MKKMLATTLTTAIILGSALPAFAETNPFTDITGSYAKDAIIQLQKEGILTGIDAEHFDPQGTLTRAQFVTILVKALKLEVDPKAVSSFTDVEGWAVPYIEAAKKYGIIDGVGEGLFAPNATVTREQTVVIMVKSLEKQGKLDVTDATLTFTDADSISDWAKKFVAIAVKYGLITGNPDGSFNPQGNATREQAAILGSNFLKGLDQVKDDNKPDTKPEPPAKPDTPSPSPSASPAPVSGGGGGGGGGGTSDTTKPSAPTEVVASDITQTGVTLAWKASTDNVGVTGYDVYQGTTKLATVTTLTYAVTGLIADTSYEFTVQAKDAAGNISSASTPLAVKTEAVPVVDDSIEVKAGVNIRKATEEEVNYNHEVNTPRGWGKATSAGIVVGIINGEVSEVAKDFKYLSVRGSSIELPPETLTLEYLEDDYEFTYFAEKGDGTTVFEWYFPVGHYDIDNTLNWYQVIFYDADKKPLGYFQKEQVKDYFPAALGDISALNPESSLYAHDVAQARITYDALSAEAKALVTNYEDLVAAEKSLEESPVVVAPEITDVAIASSNVDPTKAQKGDTVTLTFKTKEQVSKLSNFKINGNNPASFESVGADADWTNTATYVLDGTDPLGDMNFQINVKNKVTGIYSQTIEATSDGSKVTVVAKPVAPVISGVHIESSNADKTKATVGDTVTLTFTTIEEVSKLSNFKINGGNPKTFFSEQTGEVWTTTATYVIDESDPVGVMNFQINVKNSAGLYSITTEATNDESSVTVEAPPLGDPLEYVQPQDFGYWADQEAYNVGFKIDVTKLPYAKISKIEVSIVKGTEVLATRTATGTQLVQLAEDDETYGGTDGQLSVAFIKRTEGATNEWWTSTAYDFTTPTKAVITITDSMNRVITVENSNLSPTPPVVVEVDGTGLLNDAQLYLWPNASVTGNVYQFNVNYGTGIVGVTKEDITDAAVFFYVGTEQVGSAKVTASFAATLKNYEGLTGLVAPNDVSSDEWWMTSYTSDKTPERVVFKVATKDKIYVVTALFHPLTP